MGVLSNKIQREQLKIGDHIYSWRRAHIYAHHGIYVGDGKVIHFTRAARQETGAGNVFDCLMFSSDPFPLSGYVCTVCGGQSKVDGIDQKEAKLDDNLSKVDGIEQKDSKLDDNQSKVDGIDQKESKLDDNQAKADESDKIESKLDDNQAKVDGVDKKESKLDVDQAKVDGIDKKESKLDVDQSKADESDKIESKLDVDQAKVDGIDKKESELDVDQSKADESDKIESKLDDNQAKVDGIDKKESKLDVDQSKVVGIDQKESKLDGDQSKLDGIHKKNSKLDGDQSKLDGDQSNLDGDQSKVDGTYKRNSGVVSSCLDCFLYGGDLYLYEYGVDMATFLAEIRGGTCSLAFADPEEQVVHRAKFLLANGFGVYDLFRNNCIDFAIYCKTSLLVDPRFSVRRCGQVASLLASSCSFIASKGPTLLFLAKRSPYLTAVSGGLYVGSKWLSDIGVRLDATKVAVEELVNGKR